METANYEILREIEKSPYAQYITIPSYILQNYIFNINLGLNKAYTNNQININTYNSIIELCNKYNSVFSNKVNNILHLYYIIIKNINPAQNNTLLTTVNNYNAILNFINYLRNIGTFLYKNGYISKIIYNFFINVFIQNIIILVNTLNEANFSIGDLYYYINDDYNNCLLSGNGEYMCNYYMEGYKLLEAGPYLENNKASAREIIPKSVKIPNPTNKYILSSTAAANLRINSPEDQYKICIDTAFANNSSEVECNPYLYFNLN